MSARDCFLTGAKLAGGFWLADKAKPAGVPILCYHGFSLSDEHRFRPALFIRTEHFEARLKWLVRNGYKVIALSEAIDRLDRGKLGKREVVITVDDGFHSLGSIGWPLLKEYGLPATLYATTYYATHRNPIFRLAVQYFFWRTRRTRMRFDDLGPAVSANEAGPAAMWQLIHWGEANLSEDGRWALARKIAARLEVDSEELQKSRRLSLLSTEGFEALAREGLDVQLHTHRHNFPEDEAGAMRELVDNRTVVQRATGKPPVHFCYPSGIWSERHWPMLESLDIRSATTCTPGFNAADTPRFALYRFLDSQELSQRDFEAEVSGFKTLLRRLRYS